MKPSPTSSSARPGERRRAADWQPPARSLPRAAELTLDPAKQARRALGAAEAKQLAGAPQEALSLLAAAADGPLEEVDRAMLQRLHGQIALDLRRAADAVPLLLDAARRLEIPDPRLARETYLEALRAASVAGRLGGGVLAAAKAARKAPPAAGAPDGIDLLLDGLAARFTDGYAASARRSQAGARGRSRRSADVPGETCAGRGSLVASPLTCSMTTPGTRSPPGTYRSPGIPVRLRCFRWRSTIARCSAASRVSWGLPRRCWTRRTRSPRRREQQR